ncbi:hypothetical protein D1610_01745 [Sphingomonas gilva]|uniref:Uncharacterized protein n=1 Tax=Sphingomonas gilva TaxID=2305907 RepID=A0A396RTY5_9SPHN|nr:hypothetical protein [Sphingomonas gilva]RHW18892.1 hypothetical protein D1610_01745 [Sphingomonas gilva]
MMGRLLAVAALAMAAPGAQASGSAAVTAFKTGVDAGTAAPAYAHYLPIAVLQKAALVEDLPDDARFEAYGADGEPAPLDVGYAYREFRLLWMPFAAWDAGGFVFFSRTGTGQYSIAPATEIEFIRVARIIGHDPREGYSFNPLFHMWGWLSLIPLAFAWRRYRRWDDSRREAMGTM